MRAICRTLILFFIVLFLLSLSASAGITDLISGLLSPGDCSVKAFRDACNGCSFTTDGKIDETCKNSYSDAGQGCLASTYPDVATKYGKKECPAIDACISALTSCINDRCPGTDKQDCQSAYCLTCYTDGDRCAARASVDCSGSTKCSDATCEETKGENQETCCTDCGCPEGKECKNNACVIPGTEPKPDVVVSTTLPAGGGDESTTTPPQGLGILWAMLHEIGKNCSGGQVVMLSMTAMAAVLSMPILFKRSHGF